MRSASLSCNEPARPRAGRRPSCSASAGCAADHPGRGRPGSRGPRGFTLVEVVVVIGIIIVLAALTISVGVVVVEGSEVRQTETVLRQLDTALQEWETSADRKVSWGVDGEPDPPGTTVYDMGDGTPHVFLVSELLDTVGRSSAIKAILAQIDPDLVHVYDSSESPPNWLRTVNPNDPDPNAANALGEFTAGNWDDSLAILDAWDQPIRVVHPGRLRDPNLFPNDSTAIPDPDGTIRLDDVLYYGVEEIYGIAKNRQILFVSAGPDGEFGDLSADPGLEVFAETSDNVYSYQPAMP